MRRALGLVLALAACDSVGLEGGRGASAAPTEHYAARLLPTGAPRVAVYKRSESRSTCAWIMVGVSSAKDQKFQVNDGWASERASIERDRPDCFSLDPFDPTRWPADGGGSIDLGSFTTPYLPCTVKIHVGLVSNSTANGVPRPDDVPDQERLDADEVPIEGCPR